MGLDNIPREYPCALKAARSEDNRIDCVKTQEQNNCTWKNEKKSNLMVKHISRTTGMFGTDCWYRGKYGNFLLDILHDKIDQFEMHKYHFYGEDDNGLDTDYCLDMAKWMRDNTEKYSFNAAKYIKEKDTEYGNLQDYVNDWIYAIWWLEFVGKTSNGSSVWW